MNVLFLTLLDFSTIDENGIYTDLMREFIKDGHDLYIISPTEKRKNKPTNLIDNGKVKILKLQIGNTQKTNLIEKGISTLTIESKFKNGIKKYFSDVKFDLVLYSTPPITLQKAVEFVKFRDQAKTYLLLKDIFPQNAVDLGMLKTSGIKNLIYKYFRDKEERLYKISDYIGCMSNANVEFLLKNNPSIPNEIVEVCPNSIEPINIDISEHEKKVQVNQLEQKNLVFFRDGKPENILPKSLKKRYKAIECNPVEGTLLTAKDKKFIKEIICRYPFSWQFILKCLIKIGRYSFAIEEYSPEAIAVCAEYSFTSSVLTAYCKKRNIKHIDVMHGEKMYYMRDSFFKFDECYIWDEYYGKILAAMKTDKNQFVVEVPASLKFDGELIRTQKYDYTYYLGAESEEVLKKISKILEQLYKSGKKISIRPHPRYSNMDIVKKIFAFANIENTARISIEQSLLQSGAAISLYSTVLNQALWNQCDLIEERDKYGANNIRPGLTGWAQINGRDELEIDEKSKLDGYYVENMGLLLDIKCFFGTFISVAKSEGVVEGGTGQKGKS